MPSGALVYREHISPLLKNIVNETFLWQYGKLNEFSNSIFRSNLPGVILLCRLFKVLLKTTIITDILLSIEQHTAIQFVNNPSVSQVLKTFKGEYTYNRKS